MKRNRRNRQWFVRGLGLAFASAALAAPAQALPRSDGYVIARPATAPLITDARDRVAPVSHASPAPLITDARNRPVTVVSHGGDGVPVSSGDSFAWQELGMGIAVGLGGALLLVGVALAGRRGRLAHS
jgi:hypothetical protein